LYQTEQYYNIKANGKINPELFNHKNFVTE
jgi:hypothetical protein